MKIKIIVTYNSRGSSNAIVSSMMTNIEQVAPEVEVERINLDKRNFIKYLNKKKEENSLPKVIYFYTDSNYGERRISARNTEMMKKVNELFPEIITQEYNSDLWIIPERVPGNKLKTNVYLLSQRIEFDYKSDFQLIKTYKVTTYKFEVEVVYRTLFDLVHKYGKRDAYMTKQEAVEKIEAAKQSSLSHYSTKIKELKSELKKAEQAKIDYVKKSNQLLVDVDKLP